MNWKAYNELAWTESIITRPEMYQKEALCYVNLLKRYITKTPAKMLHLGCGAGGHDFYFKKFFLVTGVDLSEGMLELAKRRNPEVTYLKGDMRTVSRKEKFDAVIIPDSIMYMTSIAGLKKLLAILCTI